MLNDSDFLHRLMILDENCFLVLALYNAAYNSTCF